MNSSIIHNHNHSTSRPMQISQIENISSSTCLSYPYDEYMYFCNFQAPPKEGNNGVRYAEVFISGPVDLHLYRLFLQLNYDFFMDKSIHCIDEIRIYFSSPGGDAYAMLQIINFILKWNNEHNAKISFVADGINASAAIPIILCGARRYAYKNSLFMLHDISFSVGGWKKYARMSDLMNGFDNLREIYFDMVLSYSKLPEEKLKELWNGTDMYIKSDEALKYELIDEILEINKVKTLTYEEMMKLQADIEERKKAKEKEDKTAKRKSTKKKETKVNKTKKKKTSKNK